MGGQQVIDRDDTPRLYRNRGPRSARRPACSQDPPAAASRGWTSHAQRRPLRHAHRYAPPTRCVRRSRNDRGECRRGLEAHDASRGEGGRRRDTYRDRRWRPRPPRGPHCGRGRAAVRQCRGQATGPRSDEQAPGTPGTRDRAAGGFGHHRGYARFDRCVAAEREGTRYDGAGRRRGDETLGARAPDQADRGGPALVRPSSATARRAAPRTLGGVAARARGGGSHGRKERRKAESRTAENRKSKVERRVRQPDLIPRVGRAQHLGGQPVCGGNPLLRLGWRSHLLGSANSTRFRTPSGALSRISSNGFAGCECRGDSLSRNATAIRRESQQPVMKRLGVNRFVATQLL